jgi:hypothetical protein
MGTSSKTKRVRGYESSKNMKQWCRARGLDFVAYMTQFPLQRIRYYIEPRKPAVMQVSGWKSIIQKLFKKRTVPCPQPQL